MLSLTTGGGPEAFSENGLVGDILVHLHPINYGIFRFVGFGVLPPFIAWGPARAGEERRRANIAAYVERVQTIPTTEPITYRPLGDYDPKMLRLRDHLNLS
jgi:NAD(P)H dehydrogenase (quinone)